jgi:excinuclease UvrABC nuclease subunit
MRIRSIKPEFWRSADISSTDRQSWKAFGTAAPRTEFLYRLFDAERTLLYVGITWNPFVRWTHHSKTKDWWPEVCHAELFTCSDNRHARDWETWCIKTLNPLHNIHQKPRKQ